MNTIEICLSDPDVMLLSVENPTKEQLLVVADYFCMNRNSYAVEETYLGKLFDNLPQLKTAIHPHTNQPLTKAVLAKNLIFFTTLNFNREMPYVKQISCAVDYYGGSGMLYDVVLQEHTMLNKNFNTLFSVKPFVPLKELIGIIYPD